MDDQNGKLEISESQIAGLLNKIGPREDPSREVTGEIKSRVKEVWEEEVLASRKKKGRIRYAVAVSLVMAIGAFMFSINPLSNNEPAEYATVTRVINEVEYRSENLNWRSLAKAAKGTFTSEGTSSQTDIRTGPNSFVSIQLSNGINIRVADNSQVRLDGTDQIEVESGAIFVDSNSPVGEYNSIWVTTPFGRARDIGTQFEVLVAPQNWRVQVRDGRVEMNDGRQQFVASAGERISIDRADSFKRISISASDESWEWIANVSSPFKLEGATLNSYLSWVSKESGKILVYRSEVARSAAKRTILHGSVNGLKPLESLQPVLSTTYFSLINSESGKLVVDN